VSTGQAGGNCCTHTYGQVAAGHCSTFQFVLCLCLQAADRALHRRQWHWSARTTLLALGLQASYIAGCKMHTSAQRGSGTSSRNPLEPIRIQRQQGHHCQTQRLSELMMKSYIAVLVSLSVVLVTMMAPAASAMASHARRQLTSPPPPPPLVWPSTSATSPPSLPSSSSAVAAAEVAGSVLPPALTVRAFAFSHSVPGEVPDAADEVGAAIAMLAMSPPVVDSHGAWSASGGQ